MNSSLWKSNWTYSSVCQIPTWKETCPGEADGSRASLAGSRVREVCTGLDFSTCMHMGLGQMQQNKMAHVSITTAGQRVFTYQFSLLTTLISSATPGCWHRPNWEFQNITLFSENKGGKSPHLRMALRSIPPVPDRVPRAGEKEINVRLGWNGRETGMWDVRQGKDCDSVKDVKFSAMDIVFKC